MLEMKRPVDTVKFIDSSIPEQQFMIVRPYGLPRQQLQHVTNELNKWQEDHPNELNDALADKMTQAAIRAYFPKHEEITAAIAADQLGEDLVVDAIEQFSLNLQKQKTGNDNPPT